MSRNRHRFVPRLQEFADRCLPSVTAVVVPGSSILQISGDTGDNTITIQDNGQAGGIVVVGDGQTFPISETILAIQVDAGDGNDTVQYDLLGPLTITRSIFVDLGRGTDSFTANLSG